MTPDDTRPTVFVVEDDAAVRASLVFDLKASGFRVLAYEDAEQLLLAFDPAAKGCLIADVRLPGMDGVALLEELVRRGGNLPVIAVTGFAEVPLAVRAMKAGAIDFLEKPFPSGAVAEAVRGALDSDDLADSETEEMVARLALLSERERAVFDGLAAGKLAKQVAFDLGISPRTVEIYRANAIAKLGAKTQADLIRMGVLAALHQKGFKPLQRRTTAKDKP